MMPISAKRYARATTIIEADGDGSPVLLHTDSWEFFEFDKVGAVIWELLEEPKGIAELTDALVERFDVGRDRCEAEVGKFLDQMTQAGLVTASD